MAKDLVSFLKSCNFSSAQKFEHIPNAVETIKKFQEPTDYNFVYSVTSPYHGDDHSHTETKTGDTTAGQYRVALPDGRLQVRD